MEIVDFHSHILPGIDDGSASVEESIAMLQMEAEQGIHHVIATPHFYAQLDSAAGFLQKRAESIQFLLEERQKHHGLPKISIGAEVYFFRGISNTDFLPKLAIDEGRYILVEMPHGKWTDAMYRELEGIYTKQGLIPIIAHVDRYFTRFQTFGIPEQLEDLPVLVQANASFFRWRGSQKRALKMLEKGQIHLLGSDCHNIHDRSPKLGEAVQKIEIHLGQSALDWIGEHQAMVLSP